VQSAGDAVVSDAVESVRVDVSPAVHAGIHLGAGQNRIAVCVHDAGSGGGVGVNEVGVRIGGIVGPFNIAVSQRSLDRGERRHAAAVALQLGLSLLVGGFDGGLDLRHCLSVGLRDDQRYRVLRRAAVDGFGLPDVGVGPAGVGTGDDLHRVVDSVCVV